MSVILRLGAVNTDTPYSRLVSDGTDYDPPVDMSPVAEELYHSPPQTYPGCFGLPYQDHNYGAPPPPTPPQTPPLPPPVKETLDIKEEIVVTSDSMMVPKPDPPPLDPLAEDVDDPTRCICDFIHDDGYMIQCDKCSVWQHIVCMGLDRDSIPDTYLCELCQPRPVDRARAREFQIRKREFLKNLLITTHDSSTDTDPEEVNNRLRAYGLDPSSNNAKPKQKVKLKKRKERSNSKSSNKKLNNKEITKEKENTNKEMNKRNKLLIKDFSSRTAQAKKEKLTKKIEKLRSERISKEGVGIKEERFSSDDLREDEKIISTLSPIAAPVVQDENAQNPWHLINNSFNEWEQSYEVAKYNQYTTYVQEYLNSTYVNGHHNDIADLVTDGLRVQRCQIKELKNKRKGLQSMCVIPDGQPIIEVIGKVMTRQQYDKDNFGQRQLSPFVFFYGQVFDLDLVIDASDYGNDARFIRRSCQSNAVVRHVVAGGQAHFITVATREIAEDTEITIPFDYDYKKWNFCVECACLRNNCPVTRYQKKRLRFQKLQIQQNPKKFRKGDKSLSPKSDPKTPVKSPTKSPIKSLIKNPEPAQEESQPAVPAPDTVHVEPITPSPTKMVRRSQVTKHTSNNASTQATSGRLRSLRVPSQPDSTETSSDPITKPEPTNLRSSEVDPLTSPETKDNNATDKQDQPQEKRKLTREERKMEAIMKAFEKMEKRNARKLSVEQSKTKEKDEKDKKSTKKETEKEAVVKEEVTTPEIKEEPQTSPSIKAELPEPQQTLEHSMGGEPIQGMKEEQRSEVKEEDQCAQQSHMAQPEVRHKTVGKGKKAKKTANRRRTRNNSGATAAAATSQVDSGQAVEGCVEENSNSSSTAMPSCPSTPVTPATAMQLDDSGTAFKFLKTKRHLMNEWLIEKSSDCRSSSSTRGAEPLEVSIETPPTEEDSVYVTCLPSPRNSMDRLRRNSQSCGSRDRHSQSVESTGSAKKRWLRQAMGEGSSENAGGLASPSHAAGGMSPTPQAPLHSPGGSPPTDFVTPLKKRRLARESLGSRDSISSESPAQTPTPSTAPAGSYFSQLKEECPDNLEKYKLKNGISDFFTPSKNNPEELLDCEEKEPADLSKKEVPTDSTTSKVEVIKSNTVDQQLPERPDNSVSTETSDQVPRHQQEEEEEKDGVSSCAEMDCLASYNTGMLSFPTGEDQQISNIEDIHSSSDLEEERPVCSEQSEVVCDDAKSASSEPDSSDSARVCIEVPMEVECDSGSGEGEPEPVSGEVDSTESRPGETDPASNAPDSHGSSNTELSEGIEAQNEQCDSCNSERDGTQAIEADQCSDSSVADKVCTSSSPSSASSLTQEIVNSTVDGSHSSKHLVDRLSVVDSSTDKQAESADQKADIVTDSTGSSFFESSRPVLDSLNLEPVPSISGQPVCGSSRQRSISFNDCESNLVNSTIEMGPSQIGMEAVGASSTNITDSLLTSSHFNITDTPSVPNRHLRFLTDCQLNTEMVVDSTTQYVPAVLPGGFVNSSGLAGTYDSDSMDVTSGSDLCFNGGSEETRKSDDSLSGYPDNSSKNLAEAYTPKEKKKVSLQEYLKRKKDKPSSTPVVSSTSGQRAVSSSTTSTNQSPLRLTPSLSSLDKLPPLPSLPSLPMFEKPERKEFKSSSDLLSPIFNRKEKQEEVRKPMSLSERLRQEFGLDDSTDTDTDTENKADQRNGENEDESDVPPPPPPPPPQGQASRSAQMKLGQVSNGNALPPTLMSLKKFHTPILKGSESAPATPVSHSLSLPGFSAGIKPLKGPGSTLALSPSKATPNTMTPSLMNLLSNVKSPAQLQNDLTAQLNALKAQISKVQQSLPISSSTGVGNSGAAVDQAQSAMNGKDSGPSKPQVFDYGHQSSFIRQNSYPSSSSSKHHYHGFNKKSSPSMSYGKTSPGYNKLSPGFNKLSPSAAASASSHSQTSNHSYNSHHSSVSPLGWSQKPANSHKHLASSSSGNPRKYFSKQSSHKYSS